MRCACLGSICADNFIGKMYAFKSWHILQQLVQFQTFIENNSKASLEDGLKYAGY